MASLPTVVDVARLAQVSRQTVSNVLNSPDIVRPETRERVQRAIGELGYRPHASARRLRAGTSSTIGIRLDPVSNGISGSILDRYLHALTEAADARGMRITLFVATDVDDEIRHYERLRDLNLPTVLVNAPIGALGFPTVSTDDGVAMEQAWTHLSQLGHTRIGRSEERRVGKECACLCRSRWSPYH